MKRQPNKLHTLALIIGTLTFLTAGCATIKTENEVTVKTESEIKPIHITVDVNVKVQNALDDFFNDIDEASETVQSDDTEASSAKLIHTTNT